MYLYGEALALLAGGRASNAAHVNMKTETYLGNCPSGAVEQGRKSFGAMRFEGAVEAEKVVAALKVPWTREPFLYSSSPMLSMLDAPSLPPCTMTSIPRTEQTLWKGCLTSFFQWPLCRFGF